MAFKDNLKSELDYQGILVKELAAKCGISKNTIGNYLTGHNSLPSADTAVKIAKALNVTVEYLITGSDAKNFLEEANSQKSIKYRKIIDDLQTLDDLDLEAVETLVFTLKKRHQN